MKKAERIRVNFLIPAHLHEFVKEQADKLGIPASTMYTMIVNMYKDNTAVLDGLTKLENPKK